MWIWRYAVTGMVSFAALSRSSPLLAPAPSSQTTLNCTRYSNSPKGHSTCNDNPNTVCSLGCLGVVVASECTAVGESSAIPTQQTCTKSYSQPSLELGICVNDQATFHCQGVPVGEATCSGCGAASGASHANHSQGSPKPEASPASRPLSTSHLRHIADVSGLLILAGLLTLAV